MRVSEARAGLKLDDSYIQQESNLGKFSAQLALFKRSCSKVPTLPSSFFKWEKRVHVFNRPGVAGAVL